MGDAPVAASPGRLGVLFDVGYCLMDESTRLRGALEWLSEALRAAGRPLGPAALEVAYRQACRRPTPGEPSLLVQMLRDLGLPPREAATLSRAVPWEAVPLEAYPDALDTLRALGRAGFRVGVLANQPASAWSDLDRAGVTPLCDGVWLSGAVGVSKPDPAFFGLALRAWGLPPGQVAYVGDRPDNDVAPAKALGMITVRVRRGPHADQPARDAGEEAALEARTLAETITLLSAWRASLGPPRGAAAP